VLKLLGMIALTAGRNVPESDKERIADELDSFNKLAGPEILKLLGRLIQERKSGQVQTQIILNDGHIEKVKIHHDFTLSLDGRHVE
jgi:hypothetical protein